MDDKKESKESVLLACDDDDDIDVCMCVCVCKQSKLFNKEIDKR